jgi:microcystin-dependent protein
MIVAWGGGTAPSGWLECNGQSTAPYPLLGAIVGSVVPDLRGEFIRGWDHGRGVDDSRALRSFQADELKGHNHTVNDPGHGHTQTFNTLVAGTQLNVPAAQCKPPAAWPMPPTFATSWTTGTATTGITINPTGGADTRPRNIALMYIIKHD